MIKIDSLHIAEYISSGLFVTEKVWIHPKRIIDSYEIIFVIEGEVFIQQENKQYNLIKGDILILYPGKVHFGYCESKGKVSFYWVHFMTDFIESYNIIEFFHFEESYRITSLLKQLLHITNTPGYLPFTADLYMALILCEIELTHRKQSFAGSVLAKQILEWIKVNTDENITVDKVAKHFGYNENYISKLFKKEFNMGMKKYINQEKMKVAKTLLISTDYSVKQIAFMMGYKEENLFIKFFKYHEQVSPSKFRNTYFNTHINNK